MSRIRLQTSCTRRCVCEGTREKNDNDDLRHRVTFLPIPNMTRHDLAQHVLKHRSVIRRRALSKLGRVGIQGVDPDDITDSTIRRIDIAFLRSTIRAKSEREFWAFVIATLDNVVLMRLRNLKNERRMLNAYGLHYLANRFEDCGNDDEAASRLHEILMSLDRERDRELLLWKLQDVSYTTIAVAMDCTETALRTRWMTIRHNLAKQYVSAMQGKINEMRKRA